MLKIECSIEAIRNYVYFHLTYENGMRNAPGMMLDSKGIYIYEAFSVEMS